MSGEKAKEVRTGLWSILVGTAEGGRNGNGCYIDAEYDGDLLYLTAPWC